MIKGTKWCHIYHGSVGRVKPHANKGLHSPPLLETLIMANKSKTLTTDVLYHFICPISSQVLGAYPSMYAISFYICSAIHHLALELVWNWQFYSNPFHRVVVRFMIWMEKYIQTQTANNFSMCHRRYEINTSRWLRSKGRGTKKQIANKLNLTRCLHPSCVSCLSASNAKDIFLAAKAKRAVAKRRKENLLRTNQTYQPSLSKPYNLFTYFCLSSA